MGWGRERKGGRRGRARGAYPSCPPAQQQCHQLTACALHTVPCHRYCTFDLYGEKKTGLCDPTNGHCYDVYKYDTAVADMQVGVGE